MLRSYPDQKRPFAGRRSLLPILLLAGIALLTTQCSKDGQVLAEYNGGTVTRGEMRKLLTVFQGPGVLKNISVDEQNEQIKNYALLKIAATEARKLKLEQTEDYQKNMIYSREWTTVAAYDYILKEKEKDSPFEMVDLQFLLLNRAMEDPAKKGPAAPDRTEEAKGLLAKLNSGLSDDDIVKLIQEKSENQRYRMVGGYLDPQCISCKPNPISFLTDALDKVKDGQFALVQDQTGYWIVRRLRTYKVDSDELKGAFLKYHKKTVQIARAFLEKAKKDNPESLQMHMSNLPSDEQLEKLADQQSEHQIGMRMRSMLTGTIKELQQKHKLLFTEAASMEPGKENAKIADDTVLFTVDNDKYTFGMLNKPFKDYKIDIPDFQKLQLMHRVIVPYELIKRSDDYKEIEKSKIYAFIKEFKENQALAALYISRNRPEINVTDEEINEWYQVRKNNEFQGKTLAQVKDQIRMQVGATKQHTVFSQYQDSLATKDNLKIFKDRLKPGTL